MFDRNSISRMLGAAIALSLVTCNTSEPAGPQTDGKAAGESANARVVIGITQEFENMNPLIMQMGASAYIYFFVGRPLVSINADWEYECWMCVEIPTLENGLAEIVLDEGVKKLTAQWEIRSGAAWGDGTPVTAVDFELAWKIARSPNVSVGSKDLFDRIERSRLSLREFVAQVHRDGKRLCGLGASTKGNVLLQFCGFSAADISVIGDVNSEKFGAFTPGTWIPIEDEAKVLASDPDFLLVLPWHFRDFFLKYPPVAGRRLAFPLPKLEIVVP